MSKVQEWQEVYSAWLINNVAKVKLTEHGRIYR